MRDFEKLRVWQKAHQLTIEIYGIIKQFPREELYGLTSQIRRSASSVGANIVEGCGRHSQAELARFCEIASGSAFETHYHLMLARDLGYIKKEDFTQLELRINEIKRMLVSFIQTVRSQSSSGERPKSKV